MRQACFLAAVLVITVAVRAAAQDTRRAAGSGKPPSAARASRADEPAGPRGSPANQWRYRFYAGRWWYRTASGGWSYFDGRRWVPYVARQEYDRRPVDPALLRLEAEEGVLGYRKWTHIPGGGAGGLLPVSGTQGSLGGSPSGSFTNPVGASTAINTSVGTSTDVDGLRGGGPAFPGGGLQPNVGIGGRR
ncbi:MAG TPA: hypothetical protein VG125_09285 [Pirellulales bacterium]|jgi:hypothetical protein|nr:hypothetical protein [Pirellulales bacterium]